MDHELCIEHVPCADCGRPVSVEVEPSYTIARDAVICLECARRRGGEYASDEARWTTPPDVSRHVHKI